MSKILPKALILFLLLALVLLLVPSAVPLALGEEEHTAPEGYPVYTPVTLEAESVEPIDYEADTPYAPHADGWLPDNGGYEDPSISVRVETMRDYKTDIMLVWIKIADPSQLRTELAKPYPNKTAILGAKIAQRVDAVIAMDGDSFQGIGQGFIMRNGTVLRERYNDIYDALLIDDKGDFHIVQGVTEEKINEVRAEYNIIHAFNFGPALVKDGELCDNFSLKASSPKKHAQRIALAQMGPLSYLIVATEGPENKGSTGLYTKDFAKLVYDLGAVNAYNMDGGSSSTVVLKGKKINALSTGKSRAITDIVYFVTALQEEIAEVPIEVPDEVPTDISTDAPTEEQAE